MRVKRYQNKFDYSYTLGMAPTIELIQNKPDTIFKVYIHPRYTPGEHTINIIEYCQQKGIPFEIDERVIQRISNKGNVFVLGVFYKFKETLAKENPHILLVNPSDAGNLGTILRTGLGFGFQDIGVVTPAVDHFNPNAIRASMGAVFSSRIELFDSPEQYRDSYPEKEFYCFMLEGKYSLKQAPAPASENFSLVFGNEATGLPKKFLGYGESVYISHSDTIDSLNLAIAVGIGAHHFSKL